MKLHSISKKLIPLVFFSAFACSAQQSLKPFIQSRNLETEVAKKPLSSISLNGDNKSRKAKINETISSDFPMANEIKYFLNFYYNLSESYQEFKRLRNSFTSYEFPINDNLTASLHLINFRNLRNFNEYGVLLNLRIKPEIF